ncbi:glucose-6-phosphate isomerase [Homoserinimonas hongtaonis]|uniref:glucose-6-phosphate isomerase n=1 Tax=Homoserinimonas hongtaonis TaxID=2079791 RepID=UPI000D38A067|nr:glucose-6-phosphate isomerase [Salinibacterium hongtaonis]AWB89232.1 glucose-6-phosphate isomerase [Salinibacterium hongtaonis]
MSFDISVSGDAAEAVDRIVPQLVSDLVASRITAQDPTLWGPAAEGEAAKRLGWTEAVVVSDGLVDDIIALRDRLRSEGVDHIVLGGMGGSSLAPEVITRTAGVELTVLDATDPEQVLRALNHRIDHTAVVISSKSGSTVETDSQKRVYERAFAEAGIDPITRIIIVTDPDSPLDQAARADGYRVFNADPNVGGRYSALTAFGLVPSGLAGVDIAALLDEASSVAGRLAVDHPSNPGLILGAAIAGTRPLRDKLAIVPDGTYIVGFADWAEQLIAESTGKDGKGILPIVLDKYSTEVKLGLNDVQIVRLVESERETEEVAAGEIEISGTLGAQLLVWEYATAVAGRLLGINPFDQPDVESAKIATRGFLEQQPEPTPAAFVESGIEVRGTQSIIAAATSIDAAVEALLSSLPHGGYVSVQAYLDRGAYPELELLRERLAARTARPVTFGWGPRFLHSTGQFHKGGPAVGVFLQLVGTASEDLDIPGRPFTFGELLHAQAAGDASVLEAHGRPVLTLTLSENPQGVETVLDIIR